MNLIKLIFLVNFCESGYYGGGVFKTDKIRIFISYHSDDGEIAGSLKSWLVDLGFEAFLAHEDIVASEQWEDIILSTLPTCDVFVSMTSEKYFESEYTDQETGIVLAHGKKMIPLKMGKDPYGFINRYQALKLNPEKIGATAIEIHNILEQDKNLKNKAITGLVKSFCKSNSYDETKWKLRLVLKSPHLARKHIIDIADAAINNNQIYECFKAPKRTTLHSTRPPRLIRQR